MREFLLANTSESMTKRVLTHVNAAYRWGVKRKLVKKNNPYEEMPGELKHNYQKGTLPLAFTRQEKAMILHNFAAHKETWNGRGIAGNGYCHYLPLVKFWFLTGCRPSEGIGLTWGNIDLDFNFLTFSGGAVQLATGNIVSTDTSKNNRIRKFPINQDLRLLLKEIKPNIIQPGDLVFPSPTGKIINYGNFCKNAWKKMVSDSVKKSTPYSCRDTFITEQLSNGVSTTIVAKWCDTSTKMIESHYFDVTTVGILPS